MFHATKTLCVRSLLALAGLAFCASLAHGEDLQDSLGEGRVVLVPLNLGVRPDPEIEAGLAPVWEQMLEHFSSQDRKVVALERESAQSLWNEVMAEAKAENADAGVYDVYERFAQRVGSQVEFASIVFPSLVARIAKVRGQSASWDGVRQAVTVPTDGTDQLGTTPSGSMHVASHGARGELAAASLHVAVLTSKGTLRYEGAGGLTLLQSLVVEMGNRRSELVAELRKDAFSDATQLREGIVTAFQKPLPASRAH